MIPWFPSRSEWISRGCVPKNRMSYISSRVKNLHFLMPPCDRADQKESIVALLGPNSTMDHRCWPRTGSSHGWPVGKIQILQYTLQAQEGSNREERGSRSHNMCEYFDECSSQRPDSDVDQTSLWEYGNHGIN